MRLLTNGGRPRVTIERILETLAVLLAATCALTDLAKGKVYNKVLASGLVAAAVGLALMGGWRALGGATSLDAYPEIATWWWEDPAPPPAPPSPEAAGLSGDAGNREQSVLTQPDPEPQAAPPSSTGDAPTFLAYLGRVVTNALLAFVAGFALWWFGLWAAGDAKLFALLALLVPLSAYSGAFWPAFPSYVLLFNTFLAVLAILLTELAIRGARQAVRPTPEEAEAWRTAGTWVKGHAWDLVVGFVGVLFLFLVIKTLRMLLRDALADTTPISSPTAMYFVLFLVFYPLSRLMRHKWVGIPVVVATLGWIAYAAFFPTPEYNLATILHVGALSISVVLFLVVYELYLNVFDFKAIGVWQLKPRMILAKKTREVLKEDMDLINGKLGAIGPDGLSAAQAETLRRWWIDRGKGARIHVSRTIPFAPALFVGTLLTVVLGGYLLRTQ